MITMKKFSFNQADKDKIKEAVASLEKATAGELVIYFARRSDNYPGAGWKFASLIGGTVALIIGLLAYFWLLPAWITPLVISIMLVSLMLLAYLLATFIPNLKLSMVAGHVIGQRVLTKARDIFLQEEVFNTNDRIGILLFISELEQRVVVLGDSGINKKIDKEDWKHIVDTVVLGIKHGQTAQGIVNAVAICQDLLLKHGFTNVEKDDNELPDEMRIEE